MPDLYSPCPCGSGKKFKWCCQPIYPGILRAQELDANGQHEAALRLMDEVVRQHPDNPEAWGRRAQLLYTNGRGDEAEESWRIIEPILSGWAEGVVGMGEYPAGSHGP